MRGSIIIPVLNESGGIVAFLQHLQAFRQDGYELILVDGGSRDNTLGLAGSLVDQCIESSAGRAHQMNAGAKQAKGEVLIFLHADTILPVTATRDIQSALVEGKSRWGRFSVRLSGRHLVFRLIERMMNWRSCLTGIVTGDQAMFITREVFQLAGGFDEIPLMEDIAMSKKLKAYGRPVCLQTTACTSSRRWEQHGVVKTILLMWWLRLRYWMGASPDVLVSSYYRESS